MNNKLNVEGNNVKNQINLNCKLEQFGGIDQFEFLAIRDAVIKTQHRMKDKYESKKLTEAWLKLERSWYKNQVIEGNE